MTSSRPLLIAVWITSILAVTYLSLQPGADIPSPFYQSDKVAHFIAYGWLGLLPAQAFVSRRSILISAVAMIILGVLLEYCQGYVPQRMTSMADIVANTMGVFIGVSFASIIRHYRRVA